MIERLRRLFRKRGLGRRALQGGFSGALVAGLVVLLALTDFFVPYENSTIDLIMRFFRDPENASKEIAVIAIDEPTVTTLEEEGIALPFRRSLWGELIVSLLAYQPKAVIFDYTFKDKRESSGHTFNAAPIDAFGNRSEAHNAMFGDSAWTYGHVVIGVDTAEVKRTANEASVRSARRAEPEVDPYFDARLLPAIVEGPIPEKLAVAEDGVAYPVQPEGFILAGSRALGYVDTLHIRDSDGALRRFAPLTKVANFHLTDLAVAGLAVSKVPAPDPVADPFLADDRMALKPETGGPLPTIHVTPGKAVVAGHTIPLREDGTTRIRWRGVWSSDPHLRKHVISGSDLLTRFYLDAMQGLSEDKPPAAAELLRDKYVFVGFTMQGEASDVTDTPFGGQPGVFKYVASLDTILTNSYLREPTRAQATALLFAVATLTGMLALGISETLRRRTKTPLAVALAASLPGLLIGVFYALVSLTAYKAGWVVDNVATQATIFGTTLVCAVTVFSVAQRESLEEEKRKEHFFNLARQGLGPQVVDELLKQGEDAIPKAGGERKTLTLYFSDIAGFTTISEKLEPIELVMILNEYFEKVSRILVNKHHGYLDKFISDAVMASWGGFGADLEGPIRACYAALDARDLIREFSEDLERRGLPPLRTRIGLNSGTAVAAWVGLPGQRWYYTAFGDTVNLASRLEGANKAYGTSIMIGPITYEEAKAAIVARELDLVRVKGKKIPVRVYELMGRAQDPLVKEREIKRRYESGLAKYRARDFQGALADFEGLIREFDDSPSKTYAEFCKERIAAPPDADWDGSNELHEK